MGSREVGAKPAGARRVVRGGVRSVHDSGAGSGSIRCGAQRNGGSVQVDRADKPRSGSGRVDGACGRPRASDQCLVGDEDGRRTVRGVRVEFAMTDREELTREELSRALTRVQRKRIMAGKLEAGDVAALRRFICLTQEQFAEALGISVHTLRNWEQDRVTPDGPGLALLRIAARHPRIVRENINSAA